MQKPLFINHFENHIATNKIDNKNLGQFDLKADSFCKVQEEKEKVISKNAESKNLENFFKSRNIEQIVSFVNSDKENISFSQEIIRVQNEYKENLSSANFLSSTDWKILTAIELFDKKVFEHSIGTYLIAKEKIEERLIEIGSAIKKEGVQLEQFYRACLYHDFGKMTIPEFILNNVITDDEWTFHFMELPKEEQLRIINEQKIIIPKEIANDLEKTTEFFSLNRIRAAKFVPIGRLLNEKQLKILEQKEIDPKMSIGKIMEIHEKKSEDILNSFGYYIEGLLAGNHHNYKHHDKTLGEKPISLSAVHLSTELASNVIHLADIQQALSSNRSYHRKQPTLRILAYLIDDVKRGLLDSHLAAIWINDEIKKIDPAYLKEVSAVSASHQTNSYQIERKIELETINEFLVDNLKDQEEHYLLAA